MQECFSPGLAVLVTFASASWGGSVVTVPWILLKDRLRRTAGVVVPGGRARGHIILGRVLGGLRCRHASRTYFNMDRARYVIQNQIREGDVLITRAWIALKLDGASVNLIQHAVADGDDLRKASAKPKDRPASAEDAIGDGHELAATEKGACIVLREHDAVTDG